MIEFELFREFRRAYYEYSQHVPDTKAPVEWLALMQHHGAPTRLLDFTYSIYIAAYFAVECTTTDAAIWAVNADWALRESAERLRALKKSEEQIDQLQQPFTEHTEAVVEPLLFRKPYPTIVCPLNPFLLNERLRIQKGVFLVPGSCEATFMDNLMSMPGHDRRENVFRLVIPSALLAEIRARVFAMNISRRSLFPGLDGYAQALGIYHHVFNMNDPHRKRLEELRDRLGLFGIEPA